MLLAWRELRSRKKKKKGQPSREKGMPWVFLRQAGQRVSFFHLFQSWWGRVYLQRNMTAVEEKKTEEKLRCLKYYQRVAKQPEKEKQNGRLHVALYLFRMRETRVFLFRSSSFCVARKKT